MATLFEFTCSAMRHSDALLVMMQVLSSSNDNVGEVFHSLIETACQTLNVQHGALFMVDALSQTLSGRVENNWKAYTIPIGQYIGLLLRRVK